MADIRDFLLGLLEEGFGKAAWHGPNLRACLRGVSAAQASWRPEEGRHNIWEVAVHAAYWKYTVRRRITGEKRGSFLLKGSNWFVRPTAIPAREADWKADLRILENEHRSLVATVVALDTAQFTPHNVRLIRGVAMHDVYHAGQITLLKRLLPG